MSIALRSRPQSAPPVRAVAASEPTFDRVSRQVVGTLALTVSAVYLVWRVTSTLNPDAWGLSLWFLGTEIAAFGGLALFVFTVWRVDRTTCPPERTTSPIRVSVLIATVNEPVDVLMTTVAAALRIRGVDETWVLDDGEREWVREMADHVGARYLSRPDRTDAKAGNLNNALRHVSADAVLVLDADHVADPGIVEQLVPFLEDPAVAVVQTPQDFYNTDSFEHSHGDYNEESLFYRVMQPGKDRCNASFWCGTGALLRVAALHDVGGVATGTITEDLHTTIRLHRAGWLTAYHPHVLARGLAAKDGDQFLKQRLRWGRGAMQVMFRERPLTGPGLSLRQRLSYAATLLNWFDSWKLLSFLLLPMAVIVTGAAPLRADARTFVPAIVTVLSLQLLTLLHMGRGHVMLLPDRILDVVRLPVGLLATLERVRLRRQPVFHVTPKGLAVGRHSIEPPVLLVVLLALHLAIVPVYLWSELTGRSATPWSLRMAAAWLTVNGGLVTAAVLRIRARRFSTDRRGGVRLRHTLTGVIDDRSADVVELAPGAATVTSSTAVPPEGVIAIDLPGGRTALRYRRIHQRFGDDGLTTAGLAFCENQWEERRRVAEAVGSMILSPSPG